MITSTPSPTLLDLRTLVDKAWLPKVLALFVVAAHFLAQRNMESLRHHIASLLAEEYHFMNEEELNECISLIIQVEELIADTAQGYEREHLLAKLTARKNAVRRQRRIVQEEKEARRVQLHHQANIIQPMQPRPKIEPYDGTPGDWKRYTEELACFVLNTYMPDTQKIVEIKSSLGAERRGILAQYGSNNANVAEAMSHLERAFGNPHYLIDDLRRRIRRLPALTRTSSVSKWQELMILASEVATINGDDLAMSKATLVNLIVYKIPADIGFGLLNTEELTIEAVIDTIVMFIRTANLMFKDEVKEEVEEPWNKRRCL